MAAEPLGALRRQVELSGRVRTWRCSHRSRHSTIHAALTSPRNALEYVLASSACPGLGAHASRLNTAPPRVSPPRGRARGWLHRFLPSHPSQRVPRFLSSLVPKFLSLHSPSRCCYVECQRRSLSVAAFDEVLGRASRTPISPPSSRRACRAGIHSTESRCSGRRGVFRIRPREEPLDVVPAAAALLEVRRQSRRRAPRSEHAERRLFPAGDRGGPGWSGCHAGFRGSARASVAETGRWPSGRQSRARPITGPPHPSFTSRRQARARAAGVPRSIARSPWRRRRMAPMARVLRHQPAAAVRKTDTVADDIRALQRIAWARGQAILHILLGDLLAEPAASTRPVVDTRRRGGQRVESRRHGPRRLAAWIVGRCCGRDCRLERSFFTGRVMCHAR